MITAAHAVLYAGEPDRARAFFRDVLGMPNVDIHGGWLIFKLPPAELGVHPAGEGSPGGHHELFLMCDDIERTVDELTAKGAEFTGGTQQRPFGTATMLKVPGAGEIMLYQPSHAVAHSL